MSYKDHIFDNDDTEANAALASYLELDTEELEELGLSHDDLQENTGNSGEMLYGYFLKIPSDAPAHLLRKLRENGFDPEHLISLPLSIYHDEQPEDYEDYED